jgi:C4-dicarboxylate-specific signal transduction histidine kinase
MDRDSDNPTCAVTASGSPAEDAPTMQTSHLLEQLMQIARISALEEMASGMAHELNQPIGAIATFAQTGERMLGLPAPMVADARDILHHIGDEALKAGRGIHHIRNLFRGADGAKVDCDMAEVLAELAPVLQLLAQRTVVQLDSHVAPGLPPVCIDRLRIQHVLFTLVQNALEASCGTRKPAVRIDVSGDRYSVLTAVTDGGSGIPAGARDQLFRPFFTTKSQGTGLGLASSRAIVEAHQGTIGFDDAGHGGARFWFRLPATAGGDA